MRVCLWADGKDPVEGEKPMIHRAERKMQMVICQLVRGIKLEGRNRAFKNQVGWGWEWQGVGDEAGREWGAQDTTI